MIVSSVMNGFNETIRIRHLSAEPHLLLEIKKSQNLQNIKAQIHTVLKNAEIQVESSDRVLHQDVILRTYEGLFGGGVLKGMVPEAFGKFYRRTQEALDVGRSHQNFRLQDLLPETWTLEKDEVVVGLDLARSLGIFEGDPIVILPPETLLLPRGEGPPYGRFRVKSLLSTRLPEVDGQLIFFNSEIADSPMISTPSQRETLEIRLVDPYRAEEAKAAIEKNTKFQVSTWKERNKALFFALRLERWAMSLFLGLSTLITCFAIVSVLLLLIYQKKQEIGILMAMGVS
ncbi:MAG: ABC transporter permease, partial [Bdellovibrionales bacterium]|nr:ABC transporter permease [Bdellovibrionales bacterium]